jgi:hypothetical protein
VATLTRFIKGAKVATKPAKEFPLNTIVPDLKHTLPDGTTKILAGGGPTHGDVTIGAVDNGYPLFKEDGVTLNGIVDDGYYDLGERRHLTRKEAFNKRKELDERGQFVSDGKQVLDHRDEQFGAEFVDSFDLNQGPTVSTLIPGGTVFDDGGLPDIDIEALAKADGFEINNRRISNLERVTSDQNAARMDDLGAKIDAKRGEVTESVLLGGPAEARNKALRKQLDELGFTATQRRRAAIDELLERGVKDSSVATAMNLLNRRDALIASQQPGAAFEPQDPTQRLKEFVVDAAKQFAASPAEALDLIAILGASNPNASLFGVPQREQQAQAGASQIVQNLPFVPEAIKLGEEARTRSPFVQFLPTIEDAIAPGAKAFGIGGKAIQALSKLK